MQVLYVEATDVLLIQWTRGPLTQASDLLLQTAKEAGKGTAASNSQKRRRHIKQCGVLSPLRHTYGHLN